MRPAVIVVLLLFPVFAFAQARHFTDTEINGQHFHYVEQMPAPDYDFEKYFREHFVSARAKNIKEITVALTVNEDGSLSGFRVLKGKEAEKDIIATMKAAPKWRPGRENGKTAKEDFCVRIRLKKD